MHAIQNGNQVLVEKASSSHKSNQEVQAARIANIRYQQIDYPNELADSAGKTLLVPYAASIASPLTVDMGKEQGSRDPLLMMQRPMLLIDFFKFKSEHAPE